eukprot:TRINITY_DN3547_c0_g1_i11.p1 TRINITY_DN3547_c0_g1~~TRINITY_DN3547_c0_g1_i11.p1  ORF type:complete len:300 (+),score=98.58 TRINITY_DN3547_c0_g1_i11:76-900(+)
MYDRKTQMPMVYLNLHKAQEAASFLQKSARHQQTEKQPAAAAASDLLRSLDRPASDDAAVNGMYDRKTQMPMVFMNLHKAQEAASFLQKSASHQQTEEQPAAAAASDLLRSLDRPVSDDAAVNGMYERKTQMPMVYVNLYKAQEAASLLQTSASHQQTEKQPAAAAASDLLRSLDRPASVDAAVNGMYDRKTQMPMVFMNLHKAQEAASFLQKSASHQQTEKQPAAAAASDLLRSLDRPASEDAAVNGMYERKTQMPMVYVNLHEAQGASALRR